MTPSDAILLGVMLVMILVMVFFMTKLIRDDPSLWLAVRERESWSNMWRFGEKLQPDKNKPILNFEREEEKEEPPQVE
jgi:hypothetical protein